MSLGITTQKFALWPVSRGMEKLPGDGEENLSRKKVLNLPSNTDKTSLVKCKREGKESMGLKDNGERDKTTNEKERGRPSDNKGED